MNIDPTSSYSTLSLDSSQARRTPPSLDNTAQLLGLTSSQLSTDLQSGTTLSQLASQKGVSSSSLISSIESDLTANAPQGASAPSSTQLTQMATNIANGTRPGQGAGGPPAGGFTPPAGGFAPPAMTNTAKLLGLSSSQLSSDLQSGTTLSQLASRRACPAAA